MKTKLEEIAAKALKEPNLVFTSLAHHVTKELMWGMLNNPKRLKIQGFTGCYVEF